MSCVIEHSHQLLTGKWPGLHVDPGVFPWLYMKWAKRNHHGKSHDLRMTHTKAAEDGLCHPVYRPDSEGRLWSYKPEKGPYIPVQTLPTALREAYSIPDAVMVYADYSSCHLRIHFGGDVNYSDVKGFSREEVKKTVVALLNGKSESSINPDLLRAINEAWPSLLECTRRRDWPGVPREEQYKHYGSVLRKKESELLDWVLREQWKTDRGSYQWGMPSGITPAIPMHDGIVWAVDPIKWPSPEDAVREIKRVMTNTPWVDEDGDPIIWPEESVSVTWGPTWGDQSTDPNKWRPSNREQVVVRKTYNGFTLLRAGLLSLQYEYDFWIDYAQHGEVEVWAYCEEDRIHKIDEDLPEKMLHAASQYGFCAHLGWQKARRPFNKFIKATDGVVRWNDATTRYGKLVDDNTLSIRRVRWSYHAKVDGLTCIAELEQYFPAGLPAVREFLRFTRAMLTGDQSHQKFLHLIGLPGHGKGTLMEILAGLLPKDLVSYVTMDSFLPTGKELCDLAGKMLNISDETPKLSMKAAKTIQTLVSGGTVSARRLYRSSIPIKGVALISAANEAFGGDAYDPTKGMARRLVNLEVRRKNKGKNDPFYVEKFLKKYGQALVSLALAQDDQPFGEDPEVAKASKRLVEKDPLEDFLEELKSIEEEIPLERSYVFKLWKENREKVFTTNTKFTTELKKRGWVLKCRSRSKLPRKFQTHEALFGPTKSRPFIWKSPS